MEVWLLLTLINLQLAQRVFCYCTMKYLTVSCFGLNYTDLIGNTTAVINKSDMSSLKITEGNIPNITPALLHDFTSIQILHITNSRVSTIESDAFLELTSQCQDLSLRGNALTNFTFENFSPVNKLKIIDLSSNLLEDLSEFNASYFPDLQVFNVSNNLLKYLPIGILNRLNEVEKFYVLIDNNPWDCTDPNWSEHLTDDLIKAFCNENVFDYTPIGLADDQENETEPSIENIIETFENHTTLKNDTLNEDNNSPNCYKCSFYFCLLWLGGGIWFGIILGNIVKIKRLLCNKTPSYIDKCTQCEYSLVEQHMISGVFDTTTRRFTPTTVIGTPVSGMRKNT